MRPRKDTSSQQRPVAIEQDLEAALPDLSLQQGRPNIAAVLRSHLKQHPETHDVAVFVAGERIGFTQTMRCLYSCLP